MLGKKPGRQYSQPLGILCIVYLQYAGQKVENSNNLEGREALWPIWMNFVQKIIDFSSHKSVKYNLLFVKIYFIIDSLCYFKLKIIFVWISNCDTLFKKEEMPHIFGPKVKNSNNLEGRKGEVPYQNRHICRVFS